jgi:predicted TIM-barrel fold metal-dependent hydrolase
MSSPAAPKHGAIEKPSEAYLARQLPEETIEPDLAIVDAHHHLWHRKGEPGHSDQDNRYLLEDFVADAATVDNLVATVFVECGAMYRQGGDKSLAPVGEVEFAAGMAAMSESGTYGPTRVAAAIVGHADLTLGARVAPVLEAEIAAGGGRLRSIRHSAGWSADPRIRSHATGTGPGVYRGAGFRDGVKCLAAHGLTFDAQIFYDQIDDLVDLARAVPDIAIVLGHCGTPLGGGHLAGKEAEVFAHWKGGMGRLAQCPNVRLKLGGMTIRLGAYDFHTLERPPTSEKLARLWQPYVETCIELFGADRCMFESNFPVEKMGVPYRVLWNAFKRLAAKASRAELARREGAAFQRYGQPLLSSGSVTSHRRSTA